jgi:hypothetical protein
MSSGKAVTILLQTIFSIGVEPDENRQGVAQKTRPRRKLRRGLYFIGQ